MSSYLLPQPCRLSHQPPNQPFFFSGPFLLYSFLLLGLPVPAQLLFPSVPIAPSCHLDCLFLLLPPCRNSFETTYYTIQPFLPLISFSSFGQPKLVKTFSKLNEGPKSHSSDMYISHVDARKKVTLYSPARSI